MVRLVVVVASLGVSLIDCTTIVLTTRNEKEEIVEIELENFSLGKLPRERKVLLRGRERTIFLD